MEQQLKKNSPTEKTEKPVDDKDVQVKEIPKKP